MVHDPEAAWVTFTNVVLGLVVLACVAVLVGGVIADLVARRRARGTVDDLTAYRLRQAESLAAAEPTSAPGRASRR